VVAGKTSLSKSHSAAVAPQRRYYSGKVFIEGRDVMLLDDEDYRKNVRWLLMSLVPQAAMNSLNPYSKWASRSQNRP